MNNEELREKILSGKMHSWSVECDKGTYDIAHEHKGYFGVIDIISVGGKKTVVECDPRDALVVPMLDGWYDDAVWVKGGKWSPDTRFVSRPNHYPLLVKKDGKWAMIGYYSYEVDKERNLRIRKPIHDKWYDSISDTYRSFKLWGHWTEVFDAVKDGRPVMLTDEGTEISIDPKLTLEEVEKWSKEDIVHNWIEAGSPCTFIYGFQYKGARPRLITKEEALEKIKTHTFGMGYYSMEWTVFDGRPVLQFAEYSESDML